MLLIVRYMESVKKHLAEMSLQLQHALQSRVSFSAPSWYRAAVQTSSTYSRGRDYLRASSQLCFSSTQKPPRNGTRFFLGGFFFELSAPKWFACMKVSDGSECCPHGYMDLSLILCYVICMKNFTLMCNYLHLGTKSAIGVFRPASIEL